MMPRGRSAASIHSDSSEMDGDGLVEAEMAKLQRQFRIKEGDRHACSAQAQDIIRRQRLEIQKLQKEQEDLQYSLSVSESHSHRQQDAATAQAIHSLLERSDDMDAQLGKERQTLAQLEQETLIIEKQLAAWRRSAKTVDQRSQAFQSQKSVRTLENKLDRTLKQYSEQLVRNTKLRGELETLRLERVRFQQLQRKLEKELRDIHRDKGELISQSTVAYDARVETQSKMVLLKEKAVRDLAQYNAEMKELERIMDHEQNLKTFMATKSHERSSQDAVQAPGRRASEAREQKQADMGEETSSNLEEMFRKIHSIIGEEDLDQLFTRFIQAEDRNFALFNYVNEQNNEAETLRAQISQVQQDMDQLLAEQRTQEGKHHALLRDIDLQQRDAEAQAQTYEKQATAASKLLDQIKTGVSSMFQKLECERTVIDEMLGSSAGITDNNIMTYLSQVEQRTNELLTLHAFLSSKNLDNEYKVKDVVQFLLGQSSDMATRSIPVQPAGCRDGYDSGEYAVTDEDERPLTHQELRERTMKGVLERYTGSAGEKDFKPPWMNVTSDSQ